MNLQTLVEISRRAVWAATANVLPPGPPLFNLPTNGGARAGLNSAVLRRASAGGSDRMQKTIGVSDVGG